MLKAQPGARVRVGQACRKPSTTWGLAQDRRTPAPTWTALAGACHPGEGDAMGCVPSVCLRGKGA